MGFINFQSISIQLCMQNLSVKQFQTIIETIENKKYKSINYCLKLLIEIIDRSIVLSSPSHGCGTVVESHGLRGHWGHQSQHKGNTPHSHITMNEGGGGSLSIIKN